MHKLALHPPSLLRNEGGGLAHLDLRAGAPLKPGNLGADGTFPGVLTARHEADERQVIAASRLDFRFTIAIQ